MFSQSVQRSLMLVHWFQTNYINFILTFSLLPQKCQHLRSTVCFVCLVYLHNHLSSLTFQSWLVLLRLLLLIWLPTPRSTLAQQPLLVYFPSQSGRVHTASIVDTDCKLETQQWVTLLLWPRGGAALDGDKSYSLSDVQEFSCMNEVNLHGQYGQIVVKYLSFSVGTVAAGSNVRSVFLCLIRARATVGLR